MTAPASAAISAISEITAQISAVQARIASLSPTTATSASSTSATASTGATSTTSATASSAQAFAAQFAAATSSTSDAGTTTDSSTSASSGASTGGEAIVADAKKYLGIPYVWGGESDTGLDCSGLVQKTMADLGVHVPRVAADQQKVGTPVASLADAQPGDLLFFGKPAYHVAIYAGDNKLIESPEPGKTVHITDVYQTPTSISRITVPGSVGIESTGTQSTGTGLSASALTAAGLNSAVAQYASQFAAAEAKYSLPTGLLAAVAQQESGGNANAVSPAGAQGLMQLMPSTAAGYGTNPFDAAQSIDAAGRILSGNLNRFGNSVPLALAAYNAGAGAVSRYGGIPPYRETQNYVKSITAMMAAGG